MNSLADKQTERRFNIAFITLFSLLFLLAPSYYQPNQGGEGLFLPFNNVVWIVVSFILGLALLKVLHTGHLYVPSMTYVMFFFLGTTTILGMVNSVATPVPWLFRSLALWGGVFFFIAMAQFKLNRRWQDNLLYIIMISAAIQSIYGLIQVLITDPAPSWLPMSPGFPRGIFQQTNLNASFSATGLIIALYLITSASYGNRKLIIQALPLAAAALCIATLVSAGSRVGLTGAAIGITLLIVTRFHKVWRSKNAITLFIIFTAASAILTTQLDTHTGGLETGVKKFSSAIKDSSHRSAIYESSWELIKEKPLLGYGIGQFQKVWHEKKIEYIKNHPEAPVMPHRLSHPHNELLYWAVEGGAIAVLGILLMMLSVFWYCSRLGIQEGGKHLALLIPIGIHTQVELPFYISQLHWITFITILAMIATHQRKIIPTNLSSYARVTSLSIAFAIPVLATTFFTDSLSAINSTINFLVNKNKDIRALEQPAKNIYHLENVNLLRMRILLHAGLDENNEELLREYVSMAFARLTNTPDINVFNGLAVALHHLKDYDTSHQVIGRALAIYPTTPLTLAGRDKIMELDRKAGIFDQYWRSVPTPDPQ
ncbi:PglL family O-oligosaccharyltransferase [Motiliproteus sp. MSK22-1]|uniref:PglL family O-oligosaccharyltransferase n=1 Tax=Motiliproteus sp. MSK22-1 TaxID=1897630 RepID=UPI0009779C21|nr:Wzy polymerase domain-containing protein [Motiliproteus sp. MSK22-1]OMH38720.1 hypothetical protein BGP75_05885 [Motiliproteus sp. MSK22-1]